LPTPAPDVGRADPRFAFGTGKVNTLAGHTGAVLLGGFALVMAWGLLRDTGSILLDRQALGHVREAVRAAIEGEADNRLADLHVWAIGPDLHAAEFSVVTHEPREPGHYKALLPVGLRVVHVTVEVHACPDRHLSRAA
jgi:Co/Zn/Cd efflux system component